jgi:hypothetical protein
MNSTESISKSGTLFEFEFSADGYESNSSTYMFTPKLPTCFKSNSDF